MAREDTIPLMHGLLHMLLAGAMLALAGILVGCGEDRAAPPRPRVRIGQNVWEVELAMDAETRTAGLSRREVIPPGEGMLFIYPKPKVMKFWMDDCLVPIDIVFVGPDLRVVNAYAMQVEPDGRGRTTYSSHLPALYALEVAGGTIEAEGIGVGDRVELLDVPPASQAEP